MKAEQIPEYGELTAPGEFRLVRLLPGPIERVWAYLTDPAKRATWLARGELDPRPGGAMRLEFHNSKLSGGAPPPEKYRENCADGCAFAARVVRIEPPTLLVHTWAGESDGDESEVTFELTPRGNKVLLVLTHRRLGQDPAILKSVSAGWHTHVAIMSDLLGARSPRPFWSTHEELETEYERRLGRAAAR